MATEKDNGGSAFPRIDVEHFPSGYGHGAHCETDNRPGMSLRDYFAAKALAGLLARSDLGVPHCDTCRPVVDDAGEHYADIAYRYADAMLKERAK